MDGQSGAGCPFGFGAGAADEQDRAAAAPRVPAPASGTHMGMPPAMSRDRLPELVREPIDAGADGLPTGRCLCGKVSFQIRRPVRMVFASHDATSRRRSGGVAMTVLVRATSTAFHGWGHLVNYPLSDREVSCFCRICGTPVLVRHTAPAAMDGLISISAGMLDSTEGLSLTADLCNDEKPTFYAFAGERRAIGAAELAGMFGVGVP